MHDDVLPANLGLAEAELILGGKMGRELTLRRALRELKRRYDLILVDCPPSLGLLTVNALVAADHALISSEAEYFSLQGVEQALEVVELAKESLHPDLDWLGVVLNIADMRLVHSREALKQLQERFGDKVFDDRDPALGALRRVGGARRLDRRLRARPGRRLRRRSARRCSSGWAATRRRASASAPCAPSSCPHRVAAVSELLFKPVTELARWSATGEVSSRELVEASLERIEALQPRAQRLRRTSTPRARSPRRTRSGRATSGPFAGVPIAIKDTDARGGHAV